MRLIPYRLLAVAQQPKRKALLKIVSFEFSLFTESGSDRSTFVFVESSLFIFTESDQSIKIPYFYYWSLMQLIRADRPYKKGAHKRISRAGRQ